MLAHNQPPHLKLGAVVLVVMWRVHLHGGQLLHWASCRIKWFEATPDVQLLTVGVSCCIHTAELVDESTICTGVPSDWKRLWKRFSTGCLSCSLALFTCKPHYDAHAIRRGLCCAGADCSIVVTNLPPH